MAAKELVLGTIIEGGRDTRRVFSLPLSIITKALALLAMRRVGKSNAAVVLAEEMYYAGLPWVALDPKGDWWGIRSSADGKGPGLAVPIFGGEHGDYPIDADHGVYLADLIAEKRLTCIIDLSELSKAKQTRFLADFAERLYKKNRDPLHVFLEEADEYVPQKIPSARGGGDQSNGPVSRCVGAFSTLVKRGGFRGIGVTIISQRSASVNKDILTQIETMIAMRTGAKLDRDAIRGWLEYHSTAREIADSLPMLENGEAWVSSPHDLKVLSQVRFRRRRTFDSGATPEVGKGRPAATMADVDLPTIGEEMAAVIKRAQESDPKVLVQRIRSLERELAKALSEQSTRVVTETVEVEVVPALVLEHCKSVDGSLSMVIEHAEALLGLATEAREKWSIRSAEIDLGLIASSRSDQPRRVRDTASPRPRAVSQVRPTPARTGRGEPGQTSTALSKIEKDILTALVRYPEGRSKKQVGLLVGKSTKGGYFNNTLSKMRTSGLISGFDPIIATQVGIEALGDDWEPLPRGRALIDWWAKELGKAAVSIIETLYTNGPLDKAALASATGYEAGGGYFNNTLSKMRTLGVIEGYDPISVSPLFYED